MVSSNKESKPGMYGLKKKREVCGVCFAKSVDERAKMLEARDTLEAKRLTMLPLECGRCKKPLKSTGPRWWVAQVGFERECKHPSHPQWANA